MPVDLVVDHSVQVDFAGTPDAMARNLEMEFQRNRERYQFLKWGMQAFDTFKVVPPGIGIVHQVNLEYLAKGVSAPEQSTTLYYPDTLVGTDSHTTMINGLGIVGWGVGGIEAEAGMLGQPVYFLTPDVVGVYLTGALREGVTATDLALTVTQMLRKAKVVGKFVEFYGPGAAALPVVDRATIANMAPEYGATMGFFPIDAECVELPPRDRAAARSIAGPTRIITAPRAFSAFPQRATSRIRGAGTGPGHGGAQRGRAETAAGPDRTGRAEGGVLSAPSPSPSRRMALARRRRISAPPGRGAARRSWRSRIDHGTVLIAAITSCTNTSNPSVMLAAGLLAKKAVERGLQAESAGQGLAGAGLARGQRLS